jgi:AraC-like DNA-binding protein/mannose-6-phosphate isomerase-like protein (cupin superfamily)
MPRATLSYEGVTQPEQTPSFLDFTHGRSTYRFVILHATLDEARPPRAARTEGHAHDVYHVVFYTRGRSRFVLGDRVEPCGPGTLVITAPGMPHDFGSIGGQRVAYREVTFALETDSGEALTLPFGDVLEHYAGYELSHAPFPVVVDRRQYEWMHSFYQRLLETIIRRRDWLATHVEMAGLLAFIAREFCTPRDEIESHEPAPLTRAREYIETRFRETITIEDVSSHALLSPSYLIRAFKSQYGRTPIDYLIGLRVEAAANLLRASDLSCGEIADAVGFGDIYQFSRTFRRRVGVSPTGYRGKVRR